MLRHQPSAERHSEVCFNTYCRRFVRLLSVVKLEKQCVMFSHSLHAIIFTEAIASMQLKVTVIAAQFASFIVFDQASFALAAATVATV